MAAWWRAPVNAGWLAARFVGASAAIEIKTVRLITQKPRLVVDLFGVGLVVIRALLNKNNERSFGERTVNFACLHLYHRAASKQAAASVEAHIIICWLEPVRRVDR